MPWPVNVMRSAARGALPLSADETLEVLVYMAQHPCLARMRDDAGRGDAAIRVEVLSKDTHAGSPALYWQPENRRPVLIADAQIENPAITENLLMELPTPLRVRR